MREYWRRPEQTDKVLYDGWYATGDAGHLDKDGYLYLVDRVNDMIVTGGENVYSIEVENAIASHPAVAQVAVIGVPHDVWGEQVHAVVVLAAGAAASEDEIRAHAALDDRELQGAEVGRVPDRAAPAVGRDEAVEASTAGGLRAPAGLYRLTCSLSRIR